MPEQQVTSAEITLDPDDGLMEIHGMAPGHAIYAKANRIWIEGNRLSWVLDQPASTEPPEK